MRPSNNKKRKRLNILKAIKNNPNHSKTRKTVNEPLIDTQLEISGSSQSDHTPDDLLQDNVPLDSESDLTPDDLSSSSDPDFIAPADKLLIIPFSFILSLLKMVCCPACKVQGGFDASVTYMNGFLNDINFLCRCKNSFSLKNFPDNDINSVLIRSLITNGISKQQFQRVLQIGNFGANVHGEERAVNLSSQAMMTVYKNQNEAIIEGANEIQKQAMENLHRANQPIIISTDMTYTKRGYHSPSGHAALICDGEVVDARTAKRGTTKSRDAYGDIVDMPANKLECYVIKNMVKDALLYLGPLIERIDIDQDATLQTVIENMKWEEADTRRVNKWTGRIEVTPDMIGKSVWDGQPPAIYADKVRFRQK